MSDARARFRRMIGEPGLHLAPGVTNAFYARIAESAGFDCIFVTGAGVANTMFGLPDLGLVTMDETLAVTRRIIEAVPDVPVIADADTGYGNHLNVFRTVREFEHAGAAAMTLEDQVAPKKCGHFEGKSVVPTGEMVEKLLAATEARRDPDLVIVARTDAAAVEGLDGALARAQAYVEAGADMVFVEAPRTREDLERIPREVPAPCVVNVVEGGKTPQLPAEEYEAMGFRVALYANLALRMAGAAVERAFQTLHDQGTSESLVGEMWSWDRRQSTVRLPEWEARDADIAARAASRGTAGVD
jgi:2-methylisocitrate lyase-like PEP mutase family enzyme